MGGGCVWEGEACGGVCATESLDNRIVVGCGGHSIEGQAWGAQFFVIAHVVLMGILFWTWPAKVRALLN